MKHSYLPCALSLLLAGLFYSGCGEKRAPVKPVYRFEIGKIYPYQLEGKITLAVDAGLISYSGDIGFTADVDVRAVATNTNGYQMEMDIKNPDVTGGDGRFINTAIMVGLNNLRTWFAGFEMTELGSATVKIPGYDTKGFNAYAEVFFPDFTGMEAVGANKAINTNFNAYLMKDAYTVLFDQKASLVTYTDPSLKVRHAIRFTVYLKKDYEKNVKPEPAGYLNFDMTDFFNTATGQLTDKSADLDFKFQIVMKEGFLAYTVSVDGAGIITLKPRKE